MRLTGLGRVLFALSFAVTGASAIVTRNFGLVWGPLSEGNPWHDPLAILAGALLVATAIALLIPRTAHVAALVLGAFLLLRELVLQLPLVVAHPLVEASWYSVSENLILLAGAWTIFSLLPREKGALAKFRHVRAGQILFALALPAIGLSHFFYLGLTAPLVPAWLPWHTGWAYFTGGAYLAAGVAMITGILAKPATILSALQIGLLTFLVWPPLMLSGTITASQWGEFIVSWVLTAAAWVVAESYRGAGWVVADWQTHEVGKRSGVPARSARITR